MGQARFLDSTTLLTSREEIHESAITDIQRQVSKTKKRVKSLMKTMDMQNKLLIMMARKMQLNLEAEDLSARDLVYGTTTMLQGEEHDGNNEINGPELARL